MKKLRIAIYIIIVINIGILLFLLFGMEKTEQLNNFNEISNNQSENQIDEPSIKEILPQNTYILSSRYKGEIEISYISEIVDHFIRNTIPTLNKETLNMSDTDLKDYFSHNKSQIIAQTGNVNVNDFISLLSEIKKLKNYEIEYESSSYLRESIVQKDGYLEAILKIKYQQQDELQFKMKVNNDTEAKEPLIQFSIVKEVI